MICVECGTESYDKGTYVSGLILCEKCISQYADTEQLPMPKNVKPDLRLIVTRPAPTVERR